MTSRDPQRCCEAVRSAILATAWLLVFMAITHWSYQLRARPGSSRLSYGVIAHRPVIGLLYYAYLDRYDRPTIATATWSIENCLAARSERERERHQDRCQRIHPGIGLKQCQVSPTRAVRDPIINCTVPDQTRIEPPRSPRRRVWVRPNAD